MAPSEFATDWIEAWNAHDITRVLVHYTDDIVFYSPIAAQVVPGSGGVVRGKDALRAYWSKALERNTDLHFKLLETTVGVGSICLIYKNHRGMTAAEVMRFGEDGLIFEAYAHYSLAASNLA